MVNEQMLSGTVFMQTSFFAFLQV